MHLFVINEQAITPEDEARHMQVMAEYDAALRDQYTGPVPMCHMTPMDFHECDSDPSGRSDGYQCRHCGHSESSEEAWSKVKALESSDKPIDQGNSAKHLPA